MKRSQLQSQLLNLRVELGVAAGVGATIEILAWWMRQSDPASVEQLAEYLDRLTVRQAIEEPHIG